MKKRLHLLAGLLLLTLTAGAQALRIGGAPVLPTLPQSQQSALARYEQMPRFGQRPSFAPRRAITVDPDRQMWWGYFTGNETNGLIGFGASAVETYWGAMAVTSETALAQGKTIKAVRFAVAGTSVMQGFHLWIAPSLPSSLDEVQVDISVPVEQLNNQAFTEVELPQPITVPAGPLYIGYRFEITESNSESNYPMLIRYNGADLQNSFFIRTESALPSWTDEYKGYGPLAIQLLLEGDFPHNAVSVSSSFLDVFALAGGQTEATVTLTSQGLGEIRSVGYVVGDANSESAEQQADIEPISGIGAQAVISVPVQADAAPGRTPRYVTITKVNGVDNTIDNATSEGYCVTLSEAVPRKTVVEEFTGTWCGWCPRGITGMEKVNAQFPDQAITIVVHGDDPMEISYGVNAPSYPYAYVDRAVAADPYYGVNGEPSGICVLVGERNAQLAEASVSLQQPTLGKNGSITFKTDVTFHYDNSKAPYTMGYVLLADGLKGTGRDWAQANYYSGNTKDYGNDANLEPWVSGAGYVTDLTFNHVAVAAKGMDLEGSALAAPIKDGVTRSVSGSFSLAGNEVLQRFEGLKVVAVLFNTETGYIVNADVREVEIASDFSQNRMQVKAFDYTGVIKGEEGQVAVPVANYGRKGIHSVDYTVRTGTEESEPLHIDLPQPITSYGVYVPVNFRLPAQAETGVANYTFTITKVNGEENEATSGKSASGSIMTVAKNSKRRTVIEEFTGTWCMWCPRGMAALKRLNAEYKDDVVLMAIHGGSDSEPMKVATFNTQISSVSGFPNAHINRATTADPMYGTTGEEWGIITDVTSENSKVVEAAVDLHQPTMDASTGVITFDTDVTFQINRKSAPYLLSYVLVADGLHGDTDDWKQVNAYSAFYKGSYADDPYMNEICNEWDTYADVTFDHVAIAGLGIDNGVTNSLKTTVEEGQVQTHSAKFATKTNKLAKMATKLRVIAMLYDKTRKCFINADEKEVEVIDGVEDLLAPASAASTAVYNLSGQRLSAPQRGVNIVGGRKVVVK